MRLADAVSRFVPTDPAYAPFGWRALAGLNAVPLGLSAFAALQWWAEQGGTELAYGMHPLRALRTLVLSLSILQFTLLPMLVLVVATLNLSAARPRPERFAWLAAAVLLGAAVHPVAWFGALCALGEIEAAEPICTPGTWLWFHLGEFVRAATAGGMIATVLALARSAHDALQAQHATQLQRLNAQRQESEAHLQSLQAQIEPHFLFNTLAHIQRFHQVDPARGRAMLRSLIDYMRSALPQMREPVSTLRRELALAGAYANVQQIRMGERLQVRIDAPEELMDARMPPMMVLTLAENSVKHGLGPQREGGTLEIRARRRGDRLEVLVRDDGVGLQASSGAGMGLANTRARLATQYGRQAWLDIAGGAAGGVDATLVLPFELVATA